MNGHRQAAVALHGLSKCDQDSILAELPDSDQKVLRDYLAELSELGFDTGVAASLAEQNGPGTAREEAMRVGDARSQLHASAAAEIGAALAHEPAELIAQVMALDAWPWSAQVLRAMAPERSRQVKIALDAGVALAPARGRFLIAALAQRVAGQMVHKAGRGRLPIPAPFSRWLPWTR